MSDIATVLIMACVFAGLDRLRGTAATFKGKSIAAISKFAMGVPVGYMLVGSYGPFYILGAALFFAIGAGPGWGFPLGASLTAKRFPDRQEKLVKAGKIQPEWWQYGKLLRENYNVALAVRGAIWGAPLLPLVLYTNFVFVVLAALIIALPTAPLISREFFTHKTKPNWGAASEYIRGFIFGLITTGAYVWL
jgi:hypothetical protein